MDRHAECSPRRTRHAGLGDSHAAKRLSPALHAGGIWCRVPAHPDRAQGSDPHQLTSVDSTAEYAMRVMRSRLGNSSVIRARNGMPRCPCRDGRRAGAERDRSPGLSGLDSGGGLGISSGLCGFARAARRDGGRSGAERDRSPGRSGLDNGGLETSSSLRRFARAARRDGGRSGAERDRSPGLSGSDSGGLETSSSLRRFARAARRDGGRSGIWTATVPRPHPPALATP